MSVGSGRVGCSKEDAEQSKEKQAVFARVCHQFLSTMAKAQGARHTLPSHPARHQQPATPAACSIAVVVRARACCSSSPSSSPLPHHRHQQSPAPSLSPIMVVIIS
eukprot:TRINITY_DN28221_c0_g1_i1.p4 TRINITY_DN28221_c0_g1~~TRINITY_DN28221_c0_g1_i1.p4  ORF type:complete len:106 (-),score=20.16 TRINITY_DN28221_c0_g1_i1:77-394(-)